MNDPLSDAVADRGQEPPFWLAVMAGAPAIASLGLMVLPDLGEVRMATVKAWFLGASLAWTFALAWIQRALWRSGMPWWWLVGVVFVATYAMSVVNNAFAMMMMVNLGWSRSGVFVWAEIFRGVESCWLALLAAGASHAVVAHAFRLRHEQARVLVAQAAARDAALRALRYQLHPHFLFNALNGLSSLVASQRNGDAQAMIARLADFLRATLEAPASHEATLGEEITMAENYLDIERARLGTRLEVRWQVGPDVLQAHVPRQVLQPLIENAIRHGIAPRPGPGQVSITIARDGTRLRMSVVNDAQTETGAVRPERVGLHNLRARLQALYPDDHACAAGLAPSGFRVDLDLPWRVDVPAHAVRA